MERPWTGRPAPEPTAGMLPVPCKAPRPPELRLPLSDGQLVEVGRHLPPPLCRTETPRPLPWENALIAAPLAVRLHLAGGRVGSRPGEAAGPWQFLATWT